MNALEELVAMNKKPTSAEVLAKALASLLTLFLVPLFTIWIVRWQFPNTILATLTYWQWFWAGFVLRWLTQNSNK